MGDTGGLQAVLFDMDGLLIDSERLWLEVETETMRWLGGTWGPEQQKALVGSSLDRASAYMLELTGADVPADEVGRRMVDGMAERLGAVPGRCVVLEDSPTGVAAAEAAGCAVVAVPCLLPIPPAPGRTVAASLREVDVPRLRTLIP